MKIGIISDIHGYPEKFRKALECFKGCDMILCAGDILYHGPRNPILEGYNPKKLAEEIGGNEIPMLIAKGNCDAEVDAMVLEVPVFSPVVVYEKDGIRFMVLHGHDMDDERIRNLARIYRVNIMVTGHTHIRRYEVFEETLFINPGSVGVPKGDGIASVALVEDDKIKFINIENGEIIEEKNF